jgi:hypothetical protein
MIPVMPPSIKPRWKVKGSHLQLLLCKTAMISLLPWNRAAFPHTT